MSQSESEFNSSVPERPARRGFANNEPCPFERIVGARLVKASGEAVRIQSVGVSRCVDQETRPAIPPTALSTATSLLF